MTFTREWAVKAVRTDARCVGCHRAIELGQPAIRWAGLTDGDFGTAVYHPDCRAAEIALNRLNSSWHPDEWIPISDLDREDRDWLLGHHPTVAARMGLKAVSE